MPTPHRFHAALAVAWTFGFSHAPLAGASVVVNEVYYDAPGSDTGYEFVELHNPTPSSVSLQGFRLEAGNGAGPGRWRLLWEGTEQDVLPPGARLTLGEHLLLPPPDRVLVLALENGPDAVRIVAPDGAQDVVGYGDLTYAEYFEGRPAPDLPAGASLGRSPDGRDTGDNAADFLSLSPPTPGSANRPEIDGVLTPLGIVLERARIRLGESSLVSARATNGGLALLDGSELRWGLWVAALPEFPPPPGLEESGAAFDSLVQADHALDPVAPGDTIPIRVQWTPPSDGVYRLRLKLLVAEDGVAGNDAAEAPLRVGAGPVELSEIQYAPDTGEPEWVEVRCRASTAVDLSRFRLRDAAGTEARVFPAVPLFAEPESLWIWTEDAAAFRAAHPHLDPARVVTLLPWPRLNNEAGGNEFADRVQVRDDRGVLSDEMTYGGGSLAGHTLERRDVNGPAEDTWNWGRSALPGGTPMATNSVALGTALGGLELSSPRWSRSSMPGGLTVTYRLGWIAAQVDLRIVDLQGRRRRQLRSGPSESRSAVEWDGDDDAGRPLSAGPYLVALEARPLDGDGRLRLVQPLVVAP